jgi:PAS domain S-box-containing protein
MTDSADLLGPELVRYIVDALPMAMFVKDSQSRIVLMNKACETQWGLTLDMVGGGDASPFFPADQMERFLESDRQVFAARRTMEFEVPMWNHATGDNRHVLTVKTPVYAEDGSPRFLICTCSDVTANRRVEAELGERDEKLKGLYELSPLGIALTDMDGRFIEFNRAFERICGYTVEELKVLDYWDLTPREYYDQEMHQLAQLADCGTYGPYEKDYIRKDGARIPLRLNGVLIKGGDGKPYIWSIVEDITERRAYDKAIRDKTEQLIQSNSDLEQFAYVASHDLQTPLRSIVNFSQLLERRYKGRLDADADDFIGYIVDSGKQMTSLINDLLQYSRISWQARPDHAVASDEAVRRALANLRPDLDASGAQITVGALPAVLGEPAVLVSLFQNLIGNALKYRAPDRPLRLSIQAERITPQQWRFMVADNGIGIESQYHEKIFEIFQRLNPGTESQGTGIGLTLCRRIVNSLGGTIWVESEPGEGARFYFTLAVAF